MFRLAKGLTQAQLADLMGKSVESIANFERGKTVTGLRAIEALAGRLGVGVKVFFDEYVPEKAPPDELSKHANTVRHAAELSWEEDLEIIAGSIMVLQVRRRKHSKRP